MPLGAGLGLSLARPVVAIGLCLLLSGGIELCQLFFLAGRDASLVDVASNTLGGAVGVALAVTRRVWLTEDRRAAGWAGLVTSATLLALTVGGGLLLQPHVPVATWYGQWAPELGQFARFRGTLADARIDDVELPRGPFPADLQRRAASVPIHLSAQIGSAPPTGALAPIASIYDRTTRKVAVLGQSGAALVYEPRLLADELGFTPIGGELPQALRSEGPDSARVEGYLEGGRITIRLARGGATRETSVRLVPGKLWMGLMPRRVLASPATVWLDGLFLAVVFFPFGWFMRHSALAPGPGSWSFAVATIATTLALLPLPFGLPIAPPVHWVGVLGGTAGGLFARRRVY